jgi:DNA polymerase-3 subunit epsilon
VEGTLSLFDWRPTSPTESEPGSHPASPALQHQQPTVIVFDCETTGTDRTRDQIIELCIQRGIALTDEDAQATEHKTWRIRPEVPIHPGAQAVHGIKAEELVGCPTFALLADEIAAAFAAADVIVGYNITFDIDMLQAEYARIGRPLLDFSSKKIVDALRLWQQCEPRSLQHAHQRFVGNAFEAAHTATADVAATGRVLAGMLRAFELDGQDWDQIAIKADPLASLARTAWVGASRHLCWDGDIVIVNFGKYANLPVHELAAGPDRSFLKWVLERDFPPHVMDVCRAALERPAAEFLAWAKEHYGQPAPTERPPFANGTVHGAPTSTTPS